MINLFIWLFSFFILVALFICLLFQLACLSDLGFDYINPYDGSSRINKVVLPEFILAGFLCLFYLLTGYWVMSLVCVPYLYYSVRLYTRRQHLVDVTEIFNMLHLEKRKRLFKLAYVIFLLFLAIFWMIYFILEDEDDERKKCPAVTFLSPLWYHRREKQIRGMINLFIWLFSFFILVALLICLVYQLTCLADLEFDYINPYDSSSRINKVVLPEFILVGFLCLFYLLTGHWVMSLVCVPYLYYNVRLYTRNQHLVDVTEIFNLLHWEKKKRLFKLAYVIFLLFLAIFWMIYSILEDEDD